MKRTEDVFVTEGVPEFTFVTPPNFHDIFVDMRRRGKPLVIEGQSGTGKTTCIKKIIEELEGEDAATYLTARQPEDVVQITQLIAHPVKGTFVIDDFHRLDLKIQAALANVAKTAAEQPNTADKLPKLVLIGINNIGSGLLQLVHDVAKRTGIHTIHPGSEKAILQLIETGANELNITLDAPKIFAETKGDYWLTQQLCQTICTMAGILETSPEKKEVEFNLAALRGRVVEKLRAAYYPAVKDFCRGHRFRPSNDPYFKLLRAISQQESSISDLNELANSQEDVRGSINNIKDRRITVLLQTKVACAKYFYFNSETKSFAIEDPALFYFLKHLDWEKLRADCGFKAGTKSFEFDFAISFAGENREFARRLSEMLEILDANVFFDENFESNFLGKAWTKEFKRIFSEDSRLVVCVLDENHLKKIWPTFERECFLPRVEKAEVIPLYLDDTKFVGIPQDIIGVRVKNKWGAPGSEKEIDEIALSLCERE